MNRTARYFRALPVGFAALLLGCLPAEPIVEEPPAPTIVTRINCDGEWNIGPSEPFTTNDPTQQFNPSKAESQDLLAIQIYAQPIGATNKSYTPFAYGLFDAWEGLEVELVATNSYKMIASLVVDARSKLHANAAGYSEPFLAGVATQVTNTFTYTSARAMAGLTAGAASLANGKVGKRYTRPPLERYCAVLTDYRPAEGQTAELLLQRVSFMLKISTPDLTEGSITLAIDKDLLNPIELKAEDAGTPTEIMLSMLGSDVDERWLDPTYVDEIPCTAKWKKPIGSPMNLGTKTIKVHRNHRIPIEIYTRGKPNSFSISTESSQWVDQPSVVF